MGDPNTAKLLEARLDPAALERRVRALCSERYRRLVPLLESSGLARELRHGAPLAWLDLGCNDGTILLALARRHPQIRACGLERERSEYEAAARYLSGLAPLDIRFGSWWEDGHFAPGEFDVVSSIHAWPIPRDYEAARDRALREQRSATELFYDLFDADYSIRELERQLSFVRPGGLLLLKTWSWVLTSPTGPIGALRPAWSAALRGWREARRARQSLVLDPAALPGETLLLRGAYLVLRRGVDGPKESAGAFHRGLLAL